MKDIKNKIIRSIKKVILITIINLFLIILLFFDFI